MADKSKRDAQVELLRRHADLIARASGKAVRPYRADGFVNLMTKYGTSKDASEQYQFAPEPQIPDSLLTLFYEGNGLFAKIIDAPAEEAIKHGFVLDDVSDQRLIDFYQEAMEELDFEETAMTAIKWARLYGGSIAVMLINDGRGLEEPLDWRHIQSIDDIRVYDRSIIQPDYESLYSYTPNDPFRTRGSRLGMPERYQVFSKYGTFTVHDSRCLVFRNGVLPEGASNSVYQFWGQPEYIRINKAIRDAEVAHGSAPKLLDRSVQAIYKMKDLAQELATEEGEDRLLRRLQIIDMARGMLNSIAIDSEGEDYDFKTFQFSGVNDVIGASCNMLSAVSNIPQVILFGQKVGGLGNGDDTSMENWYNYVERIDKRMVKSNLRYLLSIVFQAGLATGEVDEVPKIKVTFNPLWSTSDTEQADLELKREQVKLAKAQTTQVYVNMQAIDPTEVRKKLADSDEYDVEQILDEYEDGELFPPDETPNPEGSLIPPGGTIPAQGSFAQYGEGVDLEAHNNDPQIGGNGPAAAPAATKLPQDMSAEELEQKAEEGRGTDIQKDSAERNQRMVREDSDNASSDTDASVGVIVIKDGEILCGVRDHTKHPGLICGPGGHVKEGETFEQAAFRETEEEFGISPKELIPLGYGPKEDDTGMAPAIFLCTAYEGKPYSRDGEMGCPVFLNMREIEERNHNLFSPFSASIDLLKRCLCGEVSKDGGQGSGNHGHEGRPGEIGGSLPSGGSLKDGFVSDLHSAKNNSAFEKAIENRMKNMPIGTKIKTATHAIEKIGDDEYKWKFRDEPVEIRNTAVAKNSIMKGVRDGSIEIEGISSEDVATAMVTAGKIDPKETDVRIQSMEPEAYKGSQIVDVSKEQFQSLREELQKNIGKAVSNDEVKEYLDAIDSYRGTDYVGVVAASAGFSGGYEGYSAHLSDEERKKAAAQADAMERFIGSADKYKGKVMRALGFDLGGDYDGGTATKQFEALISSCKPGHEIDMGHISSWSTDQSAIRQILSARSGVDETAERSVQIVFTCPKSGNGVDIGRFSKDFTQGEVAFSKDQKFVVKTVAQKEIGDDDWPMTRYEIEVDEA